jgi:hypothetical protein
MQAGDGLAYFFTFPAQWLSIELCYHAKLTNGQINNPLGPAQGCCYCSTYSYTIVIERKSPI